MKRTPLHRISPLVRKTKLRAVSKRRAKEGRVYSAKRKEFLAAHPICQVWLRENGWKEISPGVYEKREAESDEMMQAGRYSSWTRIAVDLVEDFNAPLATECHHIRKRGKNYLAEETYLAVSRQNHWQIHHAPGWARARGYLA
jgi:hypothetical protein